MSIAPDVYKKIVTAKLYIDGNFNEAIDLDRLSKEACLSRFHFHRLFTRIYRITPHQYLTRKRIDQARLCLADNTLYRVRAWQRQEQTREQPRSELRRTCFATVHLVRNLFLPDQDKAYDFYVNTLGFKVNTDAKMENGFRWLTITPPEQPDLEIALLNPLSGMTKFDDETMNAFRVLLEKGALGAGVMHTPDCKDLRQAVVPRFASVVPFAFARVPMRN